MRLEEYLSSAINLWMVYGEVNGDGIIPYWFYDILPLFNQIQGRVWTDTGLTWFEGSR